MKPGRRGAPGANRDRRSVSTTSNIPIIGKCQQLLHGRARTRRQPGDDLFRPGAHERNQKRQIVLDNLQREESSVGDCGNGQSREFLKTEIDEVQPHFPNVH